MFSRGGSVDHLVGLEDPASGEGAAVVGLFFFFRVSEIRYGTQTLFDLSLQQRMP